MSLKKLNRIILTLKSILLIVLTYITVDPILLSQYPRNVKCIVICYILKYHTFILLLHSFRNIKFYALHVKISQTY